jgi:hypothetical protein
MIYKHISALLTVMVVHFVIHGNNYINSVHCTEPQTTVPVQI